jgi:hypothetical protein
MTREDEVSRSAYRKLLLYLRRLHGHLILLCILYNFPK